MNVCTIVAKNYLAHARVLGASFREHHPDGRFTVLVIDELDGFLDPAAEPFDVVGCGDIGLPDFPAMATRYDVLELSTAVKPWLLRTLLEHDDHVIYLDPDIQIFRSIEPLAQAARDHGLVLTPHDLGPMPRDGRKPSEQDILIAGAYNLGFIGLGDRPATYALLDWWSERLITDCIVDPEKGFFVDQRWIDLVLGMTEDFTIIRDPAYNVAYWNLHNRELTRAGEQVLVNGEPLRFLHLSGYDPRKPELLSKHQNRIQLEDDPVLRELSDAYGQRLRDAGFDEVIGWPYTYDLTPTGLRLDRFLRRAWATAVDSGELSDHLFDPAGERAFVDWLREPAPEGAGHGVNRFMHLHWQQRPDLQRAFPVLDRDGAALVEWFRVEEHVHVSVPEGVVPPRETAPVLARTREDDVETGDPGPLGVNVAGYLNSEHGVGEVSRQAIGALDAAGVSSYPIGLVASASRQGHAFDAGVADEAPFPINLVCVNADQTPNFAGDVGPDFFRGRHTIGWWWWEVAAFPEPWLGAFAHVDEIWAGSRFIAENLSRISSVPVLHIPMPVSLPDGIHPEKRRLGMPDGFVFYFAFDHNSVFERKNPLGLIDAYQRAFPEERHDGPSLVIRSISADRFPDEHARLEEAAAGRRDILVLDRYLSAMDKNRMLAGCDCFVSLHRSEGFGIGMAEAMLLGKPVVATQWSGSADFMLPEHSYPVSSTMTRIGPGNAPYPPDGEWAEPDLDEAAAHLRAVFADQEEAARRGRLAQAFIREHHSPLAAGEAMRERLEHVHRTEPLGARPRNPDPPAIELDPVRAMTLQGPPPSGRSKYDPRRFARAAVLRLGEPQRRHEQRLQGEIVGAMQVVTDALRGYTEQLSAAQRRETGRVRAEALAMKRNADTRLYNLERRIDDLVTGFQELQTRFDQAGANGAGPALPEVTPRPGPLDALVERHPPVEVPWTPEYVSGHRALVADALAATDLDERFAAGGALPPGYGRGWDERVVEYPWMLAQHPGGRTLDAGSVLNHAHILDRVLPELDGLDIVTLAPEEQSYPERGISYVYADLRDLPYRDATFDTVVCLSTIEHVGMHNEFYGSDVPAAEDPGAERARAIAELVRVLAPGGQLLVTAPYGAHEDHGWLEQLDAAAVEALVEAAGPGVRAEVGVFAHSGDAGWQPSTLEDAAGARYRDYLRDPRPVDDHAVAARAVVWLRFVKDGGAS